MQLIFSTLETIENINEKSRFCSNEATKKYLTDVIVLTHATSPFLNSKTIEESVDKVKSGNYDSAFTVSPNIIRNRKEQQ